jgi:hypothetical protein
MHLNHAAVDLSFKGLGPDESIIRFWNTYIDDTCTGDEFCKQVRVVFPTFLPSEQVLIEFASPDGVISLESFQSCILSYQDDELGGLGMRL